jgi:hypothetical protein
VSTSIDDSRPDVKPSCFSVLTPKVEPYCVEFRTLADNVIGAAPVVGV